MKIFAIRANAPAITGVEEVREAYKTRRAAEARLKELGDLYSIDEVYLEDGISRAEREELLADFRRRADAAFAEHAPHLQSFSFTLYTDYFNDGSELQYHKYARTVNGEEGGALDSPTDSGRGWVRDPRGWRYGREEQQRPEGPLWKFWDEGISALLSNFDDDQLKAMFGDHVEVTVTASGHEVAPYEDHE